MTEVICKCGHEANDHETHYGCCWVDHEKESSYGADCSCELDEVDVLKAELERLTTENEGRITQMADWAARMHRMRKVLETFADGDNWTHGFIEDGTPVVIWDGVEPTPKHIAKEALKDGLE